ncbi:TPA: ThiF family adenylyltransferase [Vibrio parahaemolyticus]|nr:ThiF family adenylyltransferase [Vibrio parahaemolyticus]HCH2696630.1 ThiF family adenylyltransferase [Vibrio parahaemolyticus]HCH4930844.1 ThiF family adenylyltransferase [Vibrio parahaemolyticus]
MSLQLINLNSDLKRLRDEGYFIQVKNGFLIMRDVPYVNSNRHVCRWTIISSLSLAGDRTRIPDTHVVHFDGDMPCNAEGEALNAVVLQSSIFDLGRGITAKHMFSSKPKSGYTDYYHKMTTYASILSGHAEVLNSGISPKVFSTPEDEEDSVFNYTETASGRVGIGALSDLLTEESVAIIGLGGTGSYILDLVAKTPVREILLFDSDEFLQHNAFRAPGAPTLEALRDAEKKVEYFKSIYSNMHKRISTSSTYIDEENLELLNGVTFAFICIDAGTSKKSIVQKLEELDIPFVDVGMGVELTDGSLGGILRVTASTSGKRQHVHEGRVSFGGGEGNDVYSSNIQVADLNALNAALAVIKWKKIRGFYRDLEQEHHSTYTTDGNLLLNGESCA